MNYFAIVHHDPGSAYGVTFPDVPDCFAAADEHGELLSNAMDALEDYLADIDEPPEPSALGDIIARFNRDLGEGAFVISVPHIPRPTKSVRMNVSMDQGLLKAIDAAAKQLKLSRSAFLAQAALKEIRGTHQV